MIVPLTFSVSFNLDGHFFFSESDFPTSQTVKDSLVEKKLPKTGEKIQVGKLSQFYSKIFGCMIVTQTSELETNSSFKYFRL